MSDLSLGVSEMSGMSQMSGLSSVSDFSSADGEERTFAIAFIMGILVVGIAIVVAFLITSGDFSVVDNEDDIEVGEGRGGGEGGRDHADDDGEDHRDRDADDTVDGRGAPREEAKPGARPASGQGKTRGGRRVRTRRPIPAGGKRRGRVTVVMLTPKSKSMPAELICTVGSFAVIENMYPPDGLCNYLFYTHVVVHNASLVGIHVEESWQQFKEQVSSRTATPGGISFDARYITPQALEDTHVSNTLNALAKQNMMHYGILNMITRLNAFDDYMDRAKGAIAKLRNIQGKGARKRIIIALGLFDYNEPNAWELYRAGFKKAVEETMADTVIAISSTGSIEDNIFCYVAPTSVLDSMKLQDPARTRAKSFPDLKTHAALVTAKTMYNRKAYRIGLSLEMGTLVYAVNETDAEPENNLYRPCMHTFITQADVVDCEGNGTKMSLLSGGVKLGTSTTEPGWLMSWEDEQSLTEKLDGLKSSIDLRPGLSWLIFNVHLGDFSGQCMPDPFERVKFLKNRLVS